MASIETVDDLSAAGTNAGAPALEPDLGLALSALAPVGRGFDEDAFLAAHTPAPHHGPVSTVVCVLATSGTSEAPIVPGEVGDVTTAVSGAPPAADVLSEASLAPKASAPSSGAPPSTASGGPLTVTSALAVTRLLTAASEVADASVRVAPPPTVLVGAPTGLSPLTSESISTLAVQDVARPSGAPDAQRQEVQRRVAAADEAKDFAVGNERKVYYQEMNRFMKSQRDLGAEATIPAGVIKRWETTSKKEVWGLFKEYMADPSCASIRVSEEHVKEVARHEAIIYWWQSWWDIKHHFH